MANLDETEQQKLAEALKDTRRELEEANHFSMRSVTVASHDIKALLAVIKGYAALLREGCYGAMDEKAKETIRKIEVAADKLIETVSNICDLRKTEEGK